MKHNASHPSRNASDDDDDRKRATPAAGRCTPAQRVSHLPGDDEQPTARNQQSPITRQNTPAGLNDVTHADFT